MDGQRFDDLAKRLGGSRRSLLKTMVGLGGAAAVARLGANEAGAARRGYAGPGPSNGSNATPLHFCWPFEPQCCIECAIAVVWAADVQSRFEGCMMTDHTCAFCAGAAARDYQGACRVT